MTKWLELLHNAADNLDDDADHLREIARALNRVGYEKLASELLEIAQDLRKTESNIRESASLKTTKDVNNSFATSGAIFKSIILSGEKQKNR
jgi:hypothetical protein